MTQNRMSRRQFLQVASVGAASAAFLAACPAPAPAGDSGGEGGGEAAAEATTVSMGLTWGASFQPRQAEFNDAFMERNPDIELEVIYNTWADHNKVVPTWAAADQLPDVVYVHGSRGFPWAFEGITIPLDSYTESDEEFDVGGVWQEALRLYNFQGEQHGIPYDHGPILLGYNKDIFDAGGVDYPNADWTMDDLKEAAAALTDLEGEVPQWGYSGNCPALTSTSAPSTPADSQAFEQGPWLSGQVAMENVPSWATPNLTEFASFGWDVAPWPTGPAGRVTGAFGSGFSITNDSKVPDESWRFMREYLSVDGMSFVWGESGRGSPARKAAYDSWMGSENAPEGAQYYLEALDTYAVTSRPYQTLGAAELNDLVNRTTALLKAGDVDVDGALEAIMTDGQALYKMQSATLQLCHPATLQPCNLHPCNFYYATDNRYFYTSQAVDASAARTA